MSQAPQIIARFFAPPGKTAVLLFDQGFPKPTFTIEIDDPEYGRRVAEAVNRVGQEFATKKGSGDVKAD